MPSLLEPKKGCLNFGRSELGTRRVARAWPTLLLPHANVRPPLCSKREVDLCADIFLQPPPWIRPILHLASFGDILYKLV
jgi:hypothetical protein